MTTHEMILLCLQGVGRCILLCLLQGFAIFVFFGTPTA